MSMYYKKTTGVKENQPRHECLAPARQEDPHYVDLEQRRRSRSSGMLLDIERPVGDVDAVPFNPTGHSLLSEEAARATTTSFTTPGERNYYYSMTRKRNMTTTLETSCNNNKHANLGPHFSGGTLFREPSVPALFNTTTTTTNPNLNFENRNMLRIGSQSPTKSGPYHPVGGDTEESDFVFSGILSPSSTTAQPEQIIPDTRVDQFKLNTTTQSSRHICNNYPCTTDDYCLAHNNNDSIQKMKKSKSPRSTSAFAHCPVSFHQSIISDQRRFTLPIIRGNPPKVDVAERDRQREITPIVISDDTPNINKNNTTDQPNTPRTSSCFKSNKKDTNVSKMVAFFREGKSFFNFFNDADLKRMVGDLRTQMSTKGVCVFDNFLGVEKGKMVLNDVLNLYKNDCFVNGQLESSSSPSFLNNMRVIRGDVIKWLNGDEQGCGNIQYLMERIDAAVMMCGEQMFGGCAIKQRTRAMVACYPGNGTYYLRHIDNPCRNGRVLTCIYYLNLKWDVRTDGGLLRIYPKGIDEVANVEPIFDRVLFFWSDARNPHEVKPAYRQRFAITLWYYDEREHLDWQIRRYAETQSTSSSS